MDIGQIKLGLKESWKQFSILVLINAFVGGMMGLERTILPEIADDEFGIASAIFSFIVVFGITTALANYFAGRFAQQYGRKNMRIAGLFDLYLAITATGVITLLSGLYIAARMDTLQSPKVNY
ncbi:MAG: hypothetical protein R6V27_04955 [Balneolaceae bacterium]